MAAGIYTTRPRETATCTAMRMEGRLGPNGFETEEVPCFGALTIKAVAVLDARGRPDIELTVTCDNCQTPEAPGLDVLRADPVWAAGQALTHWLASLVHEPKPF
jgi:hypothetical protein